MVWTPGQRLQDGKYTIEKRLGHGGFGVTYLARGKNGNPVVIKTLKDVDKDSPDFDKCQQDFVNEALRLKGCQHAHIVKVYELIKEGELWGMVMEYIEGEDLDSLGKLPESEALRYIHQIGEALTVVHNSGLLHRDVKPQNIMVRSGKSEAVLIDFGIAREFTPDVTQTHTEYRTDFYAPPEQYNIRAKRGAYTDVYALAATLYKLLTGQEPEGAISRGMFDCPLAPPKHLNPNISDVVNQAILRGLELKPENRPQSVQEWLSNLGLAVAIDYTELRNLLASRKWREADYETAKQMIAIIGRQKESWLTEKNIQDFPCEDLRTIDQLWVFHSNGRFGFSVQKRIYQKLGGTAIDHDEMWLNFCERIGWRTFGSTWDGADDYWVEYSDLSFTNNAPEGHLPSLCLLQGGINDANEWLEAGNEWRDKHNSYGGAEDFWRIEQGYWEIAYCDGAKKSLSVLASRLVECNIQ
jgi:serine/threonine protein kinase